MRLELKVLLGVLIFLLLLSFSMLKIASADFAWGKDTYENVDDILIINSLGDQTSVSTFGKLGTNDWIPENGVKNYLALEGYTIANDYNPSVTNSQFSSAYNTKPDDSQKWTKLTFAGLLGDPRTTQDVYVLTDEYNTLSAQGQANSIDNLNNGLSNETTNRINGDNLLQTNINNVSTNLGNEVTDRKNADTILSNNIISVDTNSQNRDNTLQNNINNESSTRLGADNQLQTNISSEANTRSLADSDLNNRINNTNSRIDDVSNRVSKLEKTQYVAEFGARIFDSKKISIVTYLQQNFTRSKVSEVGIKVTYKFGKSYEEKLIEKQNKRLDNIEKTIGIAPVIEKVINEKGQTKSIRIIENGLAVDGKF